MRLIDADALIDKTDDRYSLHEIGRRERDDIVDALEYAPTIQPEPHWIPVTERLPELRHDVLLTVFFHERWNVAEGYRQDGEFMFWNNGRLDSVLDEENRVIAWMSKPEPYKGVTE